MSTTRAPKPELGLTPTPQPASSGLAPLQPVSSGLDALVQATLYEGFALYPYRPSALKNQRRFAFGVIYPRAWAERTLEPHLLRAEVLVTGEAPTLRVCVRFLRLARGGGGREQRIELLPLALEVQRPNIGVEVAGDDGSRHARDLFGPETSIETRTECFIPATAASPGLEIEIETTATRLDTGTWRYAIEVRNITDLVERASNRIRAHVGAPDDETATTDLRGATDGVGSLDHEAAMDVAAASLHIVLRIADGAFVSAIDPPDTLRAATAACRSTGLYPILAGDGAMLCSPIILPDYPEIAPQSPGDFFDGTEMDEMLTLRVLTMTDAEKAEATAADPRIAALIARTESLGIEETARLHGVVRRDAPLGSNHIPHRGMKVRLRPARSADAFDVILAGKRATVTSVERDIDGAVHCAVTIDDDPGADLGEAGMPGHRFYFRPDELEVLG